MQVQQNSGNNGNKDPFCTACCTNGLVKTEAE